MQGPAAHDRPERDADGDPGTLAAQVVTVVDDEEVAVALAREAVGSRLAACAQVEGPVRSVYRWEGELCSDREWRVVAKTTSAASVDLVGLWAAEHPYDVPEILVSAVAGGHTPYLEWVATEVDPSAGAGG